jgi:hypothetical protein
MPKKLTHEAIKGNIYGQFTVISNEIKRHSNAKQRVVYYNVKCDCGKEGWRASHTLKNGKTKSCKSCCKTANNTNTFLERYFKRVKERASIMKFELDIDVNYLADLLTNQNNCCKLSGLPISLRANWQIQEQTASLDRIDNTKGYVKGNLQWLHKDINNMKHIFTQDYFLELCKNVSSKCG